MQHILSRLLWLQVYWEIPFVSIDTIFLYSVWIGIPFWVFVLSEVLYFNVHSPSSVIFGVIFIPEYFLLIYIKFTDIEGREEKEVWKLRMDTSPVSQIYAEPGPRLTICSLSSGWRPRVFSVKLILSLLSFYYIHICESTGNLRTMLRNTALINRKY